MSCNPVTKNWKELSEAASKERDPQKLLELVAELNAVLKDNEDKRRNRIQVEPPSQ